MERLKIETYRQKMNDLGYELYEDFVYNDEDKAANALQVIGFWLETRKPGIQRRIRYTFRTFSLPDGDVFAAYVLKILE